MASSWYEDFQKKLNTYKSGTTGDSALADAIASQGIGDVSSNPRGVGEHLLDWGGRALDVISRPGYATGGFLNDLLDDQTNGFDEETPFAAAWEGLSGRRKEFFNPVKILNPYEEGESGLETGSRFAGDFLASIFTDPLNLIPGAAAARGARAIGDVTGITKGVDKLRSFTRPELQIQELIDETPGNPFEGVTPPGYDFPTPPRPESNTLFDMPEGPGAPPVGDMQGPQLPPQKEELPLGIPPLMPTNPLNKNVPGSLDWIGLQPEATSALKTARFEPDANAQKLLESLLSGGKVNSVGSTDRNGQLYAAMNARAKWAEELSNVRGKLYKDGQFDNPWRDVQVAREPRPEPVRPALEAPQEPVGTRLPPKVAGVTKARQNTIIRSLIDSAEDTGAKAEIVKISRRKANKDKHFYADDTDQIIRNGKAVDIYKVAEQYTGDAAGLKKFAEDFGPGVISLKNMEGAVAEIGPAQYMKLLTGDKLDPEKLNALSISKGGEDVSLYDYIQSRRQKWTKGEEIEPTQAEIEAYAKSKDEYDAAMAKYEEERNAWADEQLGINQTTRQKPSKEGRLEWLTANADSLPEADMKALRNLMQLGNERGFLNRIDKIMEREGTLDIDTVDAFRDAAKDGRITKEEVARFLGTFGVKDFGSAKKRMQMLENRINKLREQGVDMRTNTPVENPATLPNVQPLPAPVIPKNTWTKFKLDTPMGTKQAKELIHTVSEVDPDTLSPEMIATVIGAAKSAIEREFKKAGETHVFRRNKRGAKADTPVPYTGSVRYLKEFNVYSQLTNWNAITREVSKTVPRNPETGKPLFGYQRGKYMYDRVMPGLKVFDDLLRAHGIQPSAMPGGKGIPLSYYDILSSLPEKWVIQHVFTRGNTNAVDLATSSGRQVSLTQLFNIAEQATYDSANELRDFNKMLLGEGMDFAQKGPNGEDISGLVNSAAGYAEAKGTAAFERAMKNKRKKYNLPEDFNDWTPEDMQSFYKQSMGTSERLFAETLDPVSSADFIENVKKAVERNRAQAGLQATEYVKNAKAKSIQELVSNLDEAVTQSEIFSLVQNARRGAKGFTKGTEIKAPPGAADEVAQNMDASTAVFGTEMGIKQGDGMARAATDNQRVATTVKFHDAVDDLIDDMQFERIVPVADLGNQHISRSIGKWDGGPVMRAVAAYFPHLGEGKMRGLFLASNNSSTFIANHYARQLSNIARSSTVEQQKRVFNALRTGDTVLPEEMDLYTQMQRVMDSVFGGGTYGFAQRNGIPAEHINTHLRHFGIDTKQYAMRGDNPYESWRNFEGVDDPLDFMSRYFQATARAWAERDLGASISQRFGFSEYQPGFVKVKSSGKSRVAHLVDKDLYYPRDVVENMIALDRTLKDLSLPPKTNGFLKIFDSMTHHYKSGLTMYRPGHHMRNMFGDVWLSYMDGVKSPKHYGDARKVLATRTNHYDDFILDTRISDLNYKPEGIALTLRASNGKAVPLSYDDIYRLSVREGILHDFATIEDLGMGPRKVTGGVESGKASLLRPFNGRLHEKVAGISEYRDHYARMAHLMSLLDRDKRLIMLKPLKGEHPESTLRRSLEHRFQDHSARIRKWHPDGSDLTLWEKRVMRRGVLFYSWIRKAIPLVMEAYFTRPGRFLAFPKAMYTAAESNGIDLNGFTDPFPTDQLFPAWMGGMQGPQFGSAGSYLGLRPGLPGTDILDTYFDSPGEGVKTLASGLNPLFKIPAETIMGKNFQGIPIDDPAEYVLGQVPFGNITNTTLGWMNGGDKPIGEPSPSNAMYDQSTSGIRDPASIAWFNFMTGLGLMDMSKPSYQKAAEFDIKYGRQ